MSEMSIGPELVGQQVCNPARPEWGTGQVLRVQTTSVGGQPQHRVSIQFASGHRMLRVPPARLARPGAQPEREQGWLAAAAGTDLNGRLRALPTFVREFLGTPRQRLLMLAPLFAPTGAPAELVKWARDQTGAPDPLSMWSRDELQAAFAEFCARRDQYVRGVAREVRAALGAEAVQRALRDVEPPLRERMADVLREQR
jgi:hypothetical protein